MNLIYFHISLNLGGSYLGFVILDLLKFTGCQQKYFLKIKENKKNEIIKISEAPFVYYKVKIKIKMLKSFLQNYIYY